MNTSLLERARNERIGIGSGIDRVDGREKVTGTAKYAAEFSVPGMAYGVVVSSAVARGRIMSIDSSAAHALPGVLSVITHENRPQLAFFDRKWQDEVAPPGSPFKPLYDDEIHFSQQPIALVVAEDFETARYAATLVDVAYETRTFNTDLERARGEAFTPKRTRLGVETPKSRGDAERAYATAAVQHEAEYGHGFEHHNPMEMHASTVIWEGGGRLTIHDKTQGVQNSQRFVCGALGLSKDKVRVISPYIGGAFGSGLRPVYQLILAAMAAQTLERSVRVVLTRQQMFSFGHRPETIQHVRLGAERDGRLTAIHNAAVGTTSRFENFTEAVVNWGGMLYRCDNASFDYKLAPIDTNTPTDMRAPGAATGVNLFEIAMDELAYAAGICPLQLRLINYSNTQEIDNKPYTSKELRRCYREGAARFGWERRSAEPRSMRDGRELVGWGMASAVWDAFMSKTSARARLTGDGRLEVSTAMADIGTGTYTVVTQVAADVLGLPPDRITARLSDSSLPTSPVEGGSWGAASAGSAVKLACEAVRDVLLRSARKVEGSPLAKARKQDVIFANGHIALAMDRARSVSFVEAMRAGGLREIEQEATTGPNPISNKRKARFAHAAIFAEVKVDEDLGVVRVTRIVDAVAAGRIINPKTARSQILGGVVFAIGKALEEDTFPDHALGRFMNHDLAEYHMPVNADVREIDVHFVEEHDDEVNPLGVKGVGEIGIVGTAAAIANAIYHATGKRVRRLPITIDKLL